MNIKKIPPIAHTIARYFLPTIILMYAIAKIMGTQFFSAPSIYDKTVGVLSGFELTWFFYGYSFWYGVFIASSQIIAAFLLFFKKTTRLKIVLYLSIMINILVLNLTYEISAAIGMAITLIIVALFVFLYEFKLFYDYFITKPPLFNNSDRPNWIIKLSRYKAVYILLAIVSLSVMTYTLKKKVLTHNEFYGSWKPTNYEKWSRIYFQPASTFSIREGNDFNKVHSGIYKINRDNQEIEFMVYKEGYSEKDIYVLNPDLTKMKSILKMKYEFISQGLRIKNNSLNIELDRING